MKFTWSIGESSQKKDELNISSDIGWKIYKTSTFNCWYPISIIMNIVNMQQYSALRIFCGCITFEK